MAVTAVALILAFQLGALRRGVEPLPSGSTPATPLEPSEPFGRATVTLRSPDGTTRVPLVVYDAYEPDTRALGLMGRDDLPDAAGMVFRYPGVTSGGFWMKNTRIPLSIAYYDAQGRVLSTMDMEPCRVDPCPSYDPGVEYHGALEVNGGLFDRVGLGPGWHIEVPAGLPPAQ